MLRKLFLVLAALGLAAASYLPGRAQEDTTGRYAFADSTLLRDTLGIDFARLFPLADSLQMTPDTLRALSIRYRMRLTRLVELADSLHVPVDSVGITLERERFNPLGARTGSVNAFSYNTSYNLQRSASTWINGAEYNLTSGPLFVRNVTTITLIRNESPAVTTVYQTRNSTTEAGWKLSPGFSMGGRVLLDGINSDDPAVVRQVGETRDEYQVSLHHRTALMRGFTTQLDAFVGALDLHNTEQTKRGLSADASGRVRQSAGRWFTHEASGHLSTDFTRLEILSTGLRDNSPDVIGDMNGTLTLFNQSRIGLRTAYKFQSSNAGQPGPGDTTFSRVKLSKAGLDATLRTKIGGDGYVNVTQSLSNDHQVTTLNGPSSRRTAGLSADGRTNWFGWGFEGRFQSALARGEVSSGSVNGGYEEKTNTRSLEGAVNRRFLARLTTRLSARIALTAYRYAVIGNYGTPPTSRDLGSQSYRIEGNLPLTDAANTGLSLEVGRDQLVNIPSASTSANNTRRSYRAEWRWTYRLLAGLTATQRNTLSSNYTSYDFLIGADRADFDFGTATTLNAVITPRLSVDLTHTSNDQPSGNWTRFQDGFYYLQPSDRSRTFSLGTTIRYAPSPVLSFNFNPMYRAVERDGAANGVVTPQRRGSTLQFDGSLNLNLPVGTGGLLTGSLGRSYFADRSATFTSGVPVPTPLSQLDYWNASLQFSWKPS